MVLTTLEAFPGEAFLEEDSPEEAGEAEEVDFLVVVPVVGGKKLNLKKRITNEFY